MGPGVFDYGRGRQGGLWHVNCDASYDRQISGWICKSWIYCAYADSSNVRSTSNWLVVDPERQPAERCFDDPAIPVRFDFEPHPAWTIMYV